MDLVRPTAVISETSGAHTDIDLGHAERFAIIQGFNGSEELEILFEKICKFHKISASLLCGDVPPRCLKGLAGDGDGMVNIFLRGFMDFANRFFGGGVDDFESLAILAFDEFVVDETVITAD